MYDYQHYSTDAKLTRLLDAREQAEYRLIDAINANGYGNPATEPFRAALRTAEEAVERRMNQLDVAAGIDVDAMYARELAAGTA